MSVIKAAPVAVGSVQTAASAAGPTADLFCEVELLMHPVNTLKDRQQFSGQKLLHPLKTKTVITVMKHVGKNNKEFTREVKEMVYEPEFVPEAEYDIKNATRFEMKHDGSCGYIFWDVEAQSFVPYARYDVKREKDGQFKSVPPNAIPCEPQPTSDDATHWPHFVPCSNDPKAYKWYIDAFTKMLASGKLDGLKTSFTCEYMGKKFNYKPCDGVELDAAIVPHGLVTIDIPVELRTPDGLMAVLEAFPFMEGIVIYGKDHVWKVRREMFMKGSHKLQWPSDSKEKISEMVMLV